jgi:hypothetical protein
MIILLDTGARLEFTPVIKTNIVTYKSVMPAVDLIYDFLPIKPSYAILKPSTNDEVFILNQTFFALQNAINGELPISCYFSHGTHRIELEEYRE